jgi:hypothetical protein
MPLSQALPMPTLLVKCKHGGDEGGEGGKGGEGGEGGVSSGC